MKNYREGLRMRYSELLNYSMDLIFIYDLHGNLIDANQIALDTLGYNREEMTKITLSDLFKEEGFLKIKDQMKKVTNGVKSKKINSIQIITKQNISISINSYPVPLFKNDQIYAVLNIARKRNHIESKRVKNQGREKKFKYADHYNFLSDQANDMVTVINDNFEYEYINEDASFRLMGYKEEDILGTPAINLIHPEDRKEIFKIARQGFGNGEANAEFRFRHKDGHWVWLESRGKVFTDHEGNKKGLIISRDITERKRTEKKLKERIKELTCVYKIYEVIQQIDLELEEVLQKTVELIPPAWQFPDITSAKISYEKKEYRTPNYNETKWKMLTPISLDGDKKGEIEVCYLKKRPEFKNGVFLNEEQYLIENIAAILETYIREMEAEKALKQSKERYWDLIEHGPYPILLLDFDGKIIDCNNELETLLKMERGDIIGKKFYNLEIYLRDDKLEKLKNNFKDLISGRSPETFEFQIRNKVNQIRWVKVNSKRYKYKDIQYIQSIITNITESKETQKLKDQLNRELKKKVQERTKELEKANKLIRRKLDFEQIISKISSRFVGTIEIDKAINAALRDLGELSKASRVYIFFFNEDETMSNMYEWCADGVSAEIDNLQNLPKDMFPWWMKKLNQGEFIHIENVLELPKEASAEKEILENQGIKSVLVYPIYVKNKLHGFIGYDYVKQTREWEQSMLISLKIVSEIIGNKIEHQNALRKERLYLEQVSKASQFKSQFMASMSHELRTPLNSIMGFTDLLLEESYGKMKASQREFLENIRSSSQHLLNLINEIMDISKIESGAMDLKVERISIKPFLDNMVSEFKPVLKEKNLEMKLEGLDPSKEIQADPIKLKTIFNNLISNAVKFTLDGTITIKFEETKENWEFQVEDTGIGIKEENYEKIFREFQRIESPYIRNTEGTGLGLPLTRRIVNLHGGEIWFESKTGKGTIFTFTLPKTKKEQKASKIHDFLERL